MKLLSFLSAHSELGPDFAGYHDSFPLSSCANFSLGHAEGPSLLCNVRKRIGAKRGSVKLKREGSNIRELFGSVPFAGYTASSRNAIILLRGHF